MKLLAMAFFLLPLTASAATYYVRPGGSNSHSCSQAQTDSDATAKGTIQAGLDCLEKDTSGNTVIVHGGTYGDYTQISSASRGSSWSDANTLKAADGETVWISRSGDVLAVTDHLPGGGTRPNAYWIIDRIHIDCQSSGGTGVGMDEASYIRLQNMEIKDCRVGIHTGAEGLELINLHVHDIGNSAAKCVPVPDQQTNCYGIYYGGSNGLITGGSWHDMGLYCMHIYNANYTNHNVRVEDVKVCRCGQGPSGSGPGIGIFSSGHTVVNSTFAGTERAIWSSPGNTIEGNTVYDGEIVIGDQTITGQHANGSAVGDPCAYDGPGLPQPTPPVPPVAGKRLPPPRNVRVGGKP